MGAETMSEPLPHDPNEVLPDWKSFYHNYEKPGYVSGFEIRHKLGGGVFGVVYKARKESIGKPYAIKFLKVDDPTVRDQVLRELDTVSLFAQVDHPNLVSIEDKGVVDGISYIVMGYAGEETLKSRLLEGRMTEEEALRAFVQVARGVQALHEHSLVHFDLKPANIFLKGDVARVGDYGLSKLISETAMSLTTGRGTPYYMAPEMLRRKGDHRSDIYSLGVILYECLAGDVPFKGESEWEVLKAHEEQPVAFPAAIEPRYRSLIEKMLAKDPDQRYQSVSELLQDLKAPDSLGDSVRLELQAVAEPAAEHPVLDRDRPRKRSLLRYWPWAFILAAVVFMVLDEVGFRQPAFVIGMMLLLTGGLILMLQLGKLFWFIQEHGQTPRPRPGIVASVQRWLPWVLILTGVCFFVLDAYRHYRGGGAEAFAIMAVLIGGFGLVSQIVRSKFVWRVAWQRLPWLLSSARTRALSSFREMRARHRDTKRRDV